MPAKKRKRKRFRPRKLIKRLVLLAVLVVIGWLVFLAGRGAYHTVASLLGAGDWLKTAQAEQVADTSGFAAEAVFLRQETVILADKPGRANLLVEEGSDVTSGQRVAELVDKALLASIEEELNKLAKQSGTQPNSDGATQLVQVEEKLQSGEAELQATMDDYRQALLSRDVPRYRNLYTALNGTAKEVAKLQQDRLLLLQSQNSLEERQAELESKREQAVVPVLSPASGRVSFQVDGLEQLANLSSLRPTLFDDLKQLPAADYQAAADSSIEAGQPIFKVATSQDTYLLVNLPDGALQTVSEWTSTAVQVSSAGITADWPATQQTNPNLGPNQCLLKIDLPEGTAAPRFLSVTLHTEGEVFCRVPKNAVIATEADSHVFLLDGNVVTMQPVVVRQTEKNQLVVTGLTPGAIVVTNPAGLADGDDVSSRLRK